MQPHQLQRLVSFKLVEIIDSQFWTFPSRLSGNRMLQLLILYMGKGVSMGNCNFE